MISFRRCKPIGILLLLSVCALAFWRCSSSQTLTEAELSKLAKPLRDIVETGSADETQVSTTVRADGEKQFDVHITSTKPDEVKAVCSSISGVFGQLIIGHLTINELRRVVTLESVLQVQVSNRSYPSH